MTHIKKHLTQSFAVLFAAVAVTQAAYAQDSKHPFLDLFKQGAKNIGKKIGSAGIEQYKVQLKASTPLAAKFRKTFSAAENAKAMASQDAQINCLRLAYVALPLRYKEIESLPVAKQTALFAGWRHAALNTKAVDFAEAANKVYADNNINIAKFEELTPFGKKFVQSFTLQEIAARGLFAANTQSRLIFAANMYRVVKIAVTAHDYEALPANVQTNLIKGYHKAALEATSLEEFTTKANSVHKQCGMPEAFNFIVINSNISAAQQYAVKSQAPKPTI